MALFLKILWDYRKAVMWAIFAVAAAVLWWRVSAWHDAYERIGAVEARLAAEEGCLEGSKCHERLRAAAEAARLEEAARQGAAIQSLEERQAKAVRDAAAWRAKYRSAVQTNPECKAWSEQPISCPL